jgi:hypothetical protein
MKSHGARYDLCNPSDGETILEGKIKDAKGTKDLIGLGVQEAGVGISRSWCAVL